MKMYVSMTDKFLSGWGRAEGKISKFVVLCDTTEQVDQIIQAAGDRSEMKNIAAGNGSPYFRPSRYHVDYAHFSELGAIWRGNV